jgi:biotin synthase
VQLARYVIDYAGGRFADMTFDDEGRVVDFGLTRERLEALINAGTAFRTSGCPGKADDVSACNRPYGDSSPTDILSFPFAPAKRDITRIRRQLRGDDVKVGR